MNETTRDEWAGEGLEGLVLIEDLHLGEHTRVLRARRADDGRPVILKMSRSVRPPREVVIRLDRERRLSASVRGDAVPRLLGTRTVDGGPALVFEDIDGVSIDRCPELLGGPLTDTLPLAVEIARALESLHAEGIVHKDLNPSNVVRSRRGDTVKLIDLGISTRLEREHTELRNVGALEGTIQYIAPEQTGRMNRSVDRRADLYALGATLYHLFAGRPPFADTDLLALVHAHIARDPTPLSAVVDGFPPGLSDVVRRLLGKSPDARYQTATGVRVDLERCLRELRERGQVERFELGGRDVDPRLRVAQQLYGRSAESAALLRAFERAVAGRREIVFVAGGLGIGKTALVHALHRPVSLEHGLFLEGKFDQFRLGTPYAPLAQAIGRFVRGLLTAPERELETWRERYRSALGANAGVLAALVPELSTLLGEIAEAPELPAAEAENRFHLVFREFVRAHASAEHPLALFLDDLQWADLPSLRLIERLASDHETHHLLLIVAFRDHELDATHPVAMAIDRLSRAGHSTTQVRLGPIPDGDVVHLLRDTHASTIEAVRPLAELVLRRTRGNPFFLIRFLETMAERGGIWRDAQDHWRWDLERIGSAQHSDNVVEFLSTRIDDLPGSTIEALRGAACIGPEFDLRLLARLFERSPSEIQQALEPAVGLELVAPRGKGWHLEPEDDVDAMPDEAFRYGFVHDRVQQAAHGGLARAEAREIHRRLGRILLEIHGEDAPSGVLFALVNHLNAALPIIEAAADRRALAELNLRASRLARRAAAFGSAADYAEAGISGLDPETGWAEDYALALELHIDAAEAAYLCADRERMEALVAVVRARARTDLDQVRAASIEMDAQIARHELLRAIETSRQALELLGFPLPAEPTGDDVGAAVGRAMAAVAGLGLDRIAELPDAEDARIRAAMDMLVRTCAPAYYAVPPLLPIVACELVALSVAHGLTPASPFAFAVYGIVLNAAGMMADAHRFGVLALSLIERWEDRHLEARTRHVVNDLVCVWVEPLHARIPDLREVYRIGRDVGDLEYAALGAHAYVHNALYGGADLDELADEAERFTTFMRNYEQTPMLVVHEPIAQTIANLRGHAVGAPSVLASADWSEAEGMQRAIDSDSRSAVCIFHLQRALVRFHFGDARSAWEALDAAWPYLDGVPSTYHLPTLHMILPLVAVALLAEPDTDEALRAELRARVDASLEALRAWSAAGPMNHAHRVRLVEAELAAHAGDRDAAAQAFREAIDAVHRTAYLNDQALILERAARFFLTGGHADAIAGRGYLNEARYGYVRWGARAKADALVREFPQHLPATVGRGGGTISATTDRVDLDALAVVGAARALSAEIELDRLLTRLFELSCQSAGARRGLLLHRRGGDWSVVVRGSGDEAAVPVDTGFDTLSPDDAPLSLLRYVQRTGESIVLDDTSDEGSLFAADPYLRRRPGASALAVPLERKGTTAALLYLEHDRVRGAFTPERVELLRVLIAQAAVSLENAELYDAQRRVTRAQSRFVPYQFLESLERPDIGRVEPGDYVAKDMSVLFSDLLGFAPMSESLGARAVIALLNTHFSLMEPRIVESGGFIDSFNGDEIMALFAGPADDAVSAGIGMHEALARYNAEARELRDPERPVLRIGVGVNTGPLLLGAVGGRDRLKCGVVGDPVNLASRIESLTRHYGAAMLIGERTHDRLVDPTRYALREVDRVAVKGRHGVTVLYEVLDAEAPERRSAKLATREDLARALSLYRARAFSSARRILETLIERDPVDRVLPLYLARCERYERDPPEDGWDGHERLTHK